MNRPPFPSVIDSSLVAAFRSCPQKAFQGYFNHWKPGEESVHLVAGKAFAAGLEVARRAFYVEGDTEENAIALGLGELWREYGTFTEPADSPKGPIRMAGALIYYFDSYPLGKDGAKPHIFPGSSHGIEFSFAQPFPVRHPETGDPLLYCGRADMAADAFGGVFLYDEKTTSQLGASWLKQWDHRSQFTSYCWGFQEHGYRPTGVVVRGVAILKDSYNTEQVITSRADWEVARWLEQTRRDVERMVEAWRSGYWDWNLDHACNEYGGCAFRTPCKSPNPDKWLEIYFKKRVWDPVQRTEKLLTRQEDGSWQ
jgi:hypothetical protein